MKQLICAVLSVYIACFPGCSISGKNSKKNLKGALVEQAPFSVEQSIQVELDNKRHEFVDGLSVEKLTINQCNKYKQQEARLIDIPLPLQIEPDYRYSIAYEQHGPLYAFTVAMSHEQILEFYRIEMEREGWKLVGSYADIESVMIFNKPTRVCVITIHTQKKQKNKKELSYVSHVLIRTMALEQAEYNSK